MAALRSRAEAAIVCRQGANFLVLDASTPFEAVRQRADVLASIRNGEYLFKRPEPTTRSRSTSSGRPGEPPASRVSDSGPSVVGMW